MTAYYQKDGVCYGALGGRLPAGAAPAAGPFSPLVLLVDRPGPRCRGLFAVREPGEVWEAEGPSLLLPPPAGTVDAAADALIRRDGATVLNTAYARCFDVLGRVLHPARRGLRMTVVGMGDVGGTVATGLVLLGDCVAEIGIFDAYEPLCRRYALELNQVLPTAGGRTMPRVTVREPAALFDCDVLLCCATKGVPPVGSGVADVRMAQLAANRELIGALARQARAAGFAGLFCQISDPVDLLSQTAFAVSNRSADGAWDGAGLLPEQVQGYGLGVMAARARYYARQRGLDEGTLSVYGPHGQDLVVANDPGDGYDDAVSRALTGDTVRANLAVRDLGFKPYIAPGLSSGAISVLATVSGRWHYGAVPVAGAYLGCRTRWTARGPEVERRPLHPQLLARIAEAHRRLLEQGV